MGSSKPQKQAANSDVTLGTSTHFHHLKEELFPSNNSGEEPVLVPAPLPNRSHQRAAKPWSAVIS